MRRDMGLSRWLAYFRRLLATIYEILLCRLCFGKHIRVASASEELQGRKNCAADAKVSVARVQWESRMVRHRQSWLSNILDVTAVTSPREFTHCPSARQSAILDSCSAESEAHREALRLVHSTSPVAHYVGRCGGQAEGCRQDEQRGVSGLSQ